MESTPSSSYHTNLNKPSTDRSCILLHETRYFINNSKSKYVSVGLFYDNFTHSFKPSVWFGNPKFKNCIVLEERDWANLLEYKQTINSNDSENTKPIILNSCKISFESFNDVRVLKCEDNFSNYIYLGDESVLGLWLISDVVQYRLHMLQSLNFDSFFKNLLANVTNFNFVNLTSSVNNKLNSIPLSENACIGKEFVAHYPLLLEQILPRPGGYY